MLILGGIGASLPGIQVYGFACLGGSTKAREHADAVVMQLKLGSMGCTDHFLAGVAFMSV